MLSLSDPVADAPLSFSGSGTHKRYPKEPKERIETYIQEWGVEMT